MRQSPSLIKALEAAAEALNSQSNDLKELADRAAATSGIPADRILMNIDLTGINLTGKPIDYLTDRGALYLAATLTDEQRAKFHKGEREGRARQTRKQIRSIRVQMISDFIDTFEEHSVPPLDEKHERLLDATLLRHILLDPIGSDYPSDKPLDEHYTQRVLARLVPFAQKRNLDFFRELFRLLGDLHCKIGETVVGLVFDDYAARFQDAVVDLIRQLQPNGLLDAKWITREGRDRHSLNVGKGKYNDPQILPIVFTKRAQEINDFRTVHPAAIEFALDQIQNPLQRLSFLEEVAFECSGDEAERIALRIVNADWPASQTRKVLEADVPPRVRGALFRQILKQGNVERTLEMLRWLDNNRGAVGALSLDDALATINSFVALFDFASDVHMELRTNQKEVLRRALERNATSSAQREKVRRLLPN